MNKQSYVYILFSKRNGTLYVGVTSNLIKRVYEHKNKFVDGFTKKLSSSIMVGEETGALDTMLNSVANQMEYDSEMALDKMVALIEPVMVVVMAVVIGFIIISIIQPIYGSYQSIADSVG